MINTKNMIRRVMKENHISQAEVSRRLGVHYSTAHGILSRNTLQVRKLGDLCDILNYNFFEEIASQISLKTAEPDKDSNQTKEELSEEIERLKEENKLLHAKIEVLKEVIEK